MSQLFATINEDAFARLPDAEARAILRQILDLLKYDIVTVEDIEKIVIDRDLLARTDDPCPDDADPDASWLEIAYRCPDCGHEWIEEWDCACDSECPECGARNIMALKCRDADAAEDDPETPWIDA